MKSVNVKFGFSAVNAGQRNVNYDPQVIAVSTPGGFRITSPVSKILNVQHGDYIMFINNIPGIDQAIAERNEALVEFCDENGIDFDSQEAAIAIHKEFDKWGIAKGIVEKDAKGNVRTTNERLTKDERMKFVKENLEEMLEAAMAQNDDELKAALSREDATLEEKMNILCPFVKGREIPKYRGSKVASPSEVTGAGVNLTFTDTNVWNQLKYDLGDNANKINRIFDADVTTVEQIFVFDGYEDVKVNVVMMGEYTDKAPARIGTANEE